MSTPERYRRIHELFAEAVALEESAQQVLLQRECADDTEMFEEVRLMLDRDRDPTSVFDRPVIEFDADVTESLIESPAALMAGERLGRYRLKRVIAAGGMGTVYEAVQEKPHRTVAVKVMKRGLASRSALRRFEYEAQILARLRHPGIAQVYEAGVHEEGSEGSRQKGIEASSVRAADVAQSPDALMPRSLDAFAVPYFVMEYIPSARPITKYAGEKRLSTRERLELFIDVCEAVHHGHQKGIIHRDLKPGNILVDSTGAVKVIDFGVARGTDSDMAVTTMQTSVGQLIGTLQYMSPEQCAGDPHDLDTRSDIYALGVVLYELLCSQLPYDVTRVSIPEAVRIVKEQSPTRPSTFSRVLRGDIETITLKAMEKDRDRRYASALELVQDIQRYLNNEPILAAPPSAMYRIRKFARRHKARVAFGAAVAMALVSATAVSMTFASSEARQRVLADEKAREAVAAREEAERRQSELQKVSDFQASMLREVDAELMGARLREDVLREARLAWERSRADEEDLEQRADQLDRLVAGMSFTNAAVRSIERNVLARALDAIGRDFDESPLLQAALLHTLAATYSNLGLYEDAAVPMGQALEIRRALLGDEHPETLAVLQAMGQLLRDQGKFAEAELRLRKALEARRRLLGEDHPDTLDALHNVGVVLRHMGHYEKALTYLKEALAGRERVLGDQHPETINTVNSIAVLLSSRRDLLEAEEYAVRALDAHRRVMGDDHPHTLAAINTMGLLLHQQGRFAEAEPYYVEALAGLRRTLGDDHLNTLTVINNFGSVLQSLNRFAEAERYLREALATSRRVFGDEHPHVVVGMSNLGSLLLRRGKVVEAESLLREALDGCRRIFDDDHPNTLTTINHLGGAVRAQGRFADAASFFRAAWEGRRRVLGEEHPDALQSLNELAGMQVMAGAFDEAVDVFQRLVSRLHDEDNGESPRLVNAKRVYAYTLNHLGRHAEAEQVAREILAHCDSMSLEGSTRGEALRELGWALLGQERFDEAQAHLRAAVEIMQDSGITGWAAARVNSTLGECLAALARFDEAEPLLLGSYDVLRESRGADFPDTRVALRRIVALYDAWHAASPGNGYHTEAAHWRAELDGENSSPSEVGNPTRSMP